MLNITGPSIASQDRHGFVAMDLSTENSVLQSWNEAEKDGLYGDASSSRVTCGAFNVRRYTISSFSDLVAAIGVGNAVDWTGALNVSYTDSDETDHAARIYSGLLWVRSATMMLFAGAFIRDDDVLVNGSFDINTVSGYIYIYS